MVFGTFDILHPGHIHMLKEAKEYGDVLIAVVARDATVEEVKKHKPVNGESERVENLKKLNLTDKVLLGNLDDKHKVVLEEKPDTIALGYDQQFFVDNLEKILNGVKIVRLSAFKPEIYKSSKLPADYII